MDKRIQLIDEDARQDIEVDGVRFEVRQAGGYIRAALAMVYTQDEEGNLVASPDRVGPIIAKVITKFYDWPDVSPAKVLRTLPDGFLVIKICRAVTDAAMLSDNESKNSDSSLGSPSTISTGTADNATEKTEDASDTDNEL